MTLIVAKVGFNSVFFNGIVIMIFNKTTKGFRPMRLIILFFMFLSLISLAKDQNKTLKILPLADNVYQHISYKTIEPWGEVAASGLILVEGNNAHIIDTPWSFTDTEKLLAWLTKKNLTVKSSVVTHFHEDASGGVALLNNRKIKTYATPLTNSLLKKANRTMSSNVITDNPFQLVLNEIEIFYPGAGHSPDNVVVWLPKSKILFGGCFVKSLGSKNLGNTEDASVNNWPKAIAQVSKQYQEIEMVVPGHGKVGDVSLLKHTAQLALSAQLPE